MEFAQNASNLHKKIGLALLETTGFKGCSFLQEVPVSELFSEYSNNRDRYDWVIPQRFTIIEAHGIQHYKNQSFGADAAEALMNFQTQQNRDKHKEEIALLNGWTYIIIPYTDEAKIDAAYLQEAYIKNYNDSDIKSNTESDEPNPYHVQQLQKAKQYRKEQYQKMKVKKNEYRRSRTITTNSSNKEGA